MTTTCQICGRAIRTVVGYGGTGATQSDMNAGRTDRIAHHGYQRPHQQGWQTASCFGARWRPYEVASDALPPAIAGIESYLSNQRTGLAKLLAEPPATLRYNKARGGSWRAAEWIDVPKPEGFTFDPNAKRHSLEYNSYAYLFLNQKSAIESDINGAEQHLDFMAKRLARWYPTVAA